MQQNIFVRAAISLRGHARLLQHLFYFGAHESTALAERCIAIAKFGYCHDMSSVVCDELEVTINYSFLKLATLTNDTLSLGLSTKTYTDVI